MNENKIIKTGRAINMNKCWPALAFLLAAGAASEAAARRIKPPWRGDSLTSPDTYMVTKGGTHDGDSDELDIGVLRWDTTLSAWSTSKELGEATWDTKEEDLIWDMPLYAPMDGYIVSCWNDMPDVTNNTDMAAGNHVTIVSKDWSHIIFVGHLREDSVPTTLCPLTGPNPDGTRLGCESLGAPTGWDQIKEETVVGDAGDLPEVRQGELIGYVGMSGASGNNPHLHMHVKAFNYYYDSVRGKDIPCVSTAEPMAFDEAWSTPLSTTARPADGDWVRLTNDVPNYTSAWEAFWPEPSGIQRGTHTLTESTIPAIALTYGGTLSLEGVVAYRASNGDLKVSELNINTTGVSEGSTVTEADADRIAIARVDDGVQSVVVAIRNDATDQLQLLPYNILSNRSLDKGGVLTSANDITDVAITRAPYDMGVVVASTDWTSSDLKVKAYGATVTASDITLTGRDSDTSTDNVTNVDIASIVAGRGFWEGSEDPFVGVVTAERRSDTKGWLRTWEVADDGNTVLFADEIKLTSLTSGLDFTPTDIDVSVVGNPANRQFVVVSLRHSSNGNLYVQTYEVDVDGFLSPFDQWTAGTIDMLASTDAGESDVAIGVRTSGILSVLSFSVDELGYLGRSGTRDLAGVSASANSVAIDGYASQNALITAAIKADGDLSVGYYYTNYSSAL